MADRLTEKSYEESSPPVVRVLGFFGGLVVFFLLLGIDLDPGKPQIGRMAAITALMAVWWMTEALPIPVTSLLPLALFPVLKIMSGKLTAPLYMDSNIFLFLGGFFIALTIEKWGLHKRIALWIIYLIGSRPRQIVLGFMLATAGISMWISNTATAMMMLPIGLSIIKQARDMAKTPESVDNFALVLMLGIAYSASIGGMGTFVGTPPNIIFRAVFEITFPDAPKISFLQFMLWGMPVALSFLLISWVILVYLIAPLGKEPLMGEGGIIKQELQNLGPLSRPEMTILAIFLSTALLWIFRVSIDLGPLVIPGWANLMGLEKTIDDGTVAMTMGIILFLIPANLKTGEFLLDWETALKVPWGVLLLFGGGFALAAGIKDSGLSEYMVNYFVGLKNLHPFFLIVLVCLFITALSELMSNTACAQMILPVVARLAVAIGVNPLLLMVPATLAASCGFMLPVATPPNAIVYSSGYIPVRKMAKAGIYLDIIAAIIISVVVWFSLKFIGHIEPTVLPVWAK
jgi:sodium-dependent dicarboxylate transporter 2/3/5